MEGKRLTEDQFNEQLLLRYQTLIDEAESLKKFMESRGIKFDEAEEKSVEQNSTQDQEKQEIIIQNGSIQKRTYTRKNAIRIPDKYSSELSWNEKFLYLLNRDGEQFANDISQAIKDDLEPELNLDYIQERVRSAGSVLNRKGYLDSKKVGNKFLYNLSGEFIQELIYGKSTH